jgi:hypothetical protein
VKKSNVMGWAEHTGRREMSAGFLWRNLKGRGHLGDLGVDGRIDNIKKDCKEMG